MKFLPAILLLFACSFAHAQSESNNTIFQHRNQLKFSLFPLHNPVNSGLEFSYERQYHDRWATQLAFTILSNGLHEMFDTEKEYLASKATALASNRNGSIPRGAHARSGNTFPWMPTVSKSIPFAPPTATPRP